MLCVLSSNTPQENSRVVWSMSYSSMRITTFSSWSTWRISVNLNKTLGHSESWIVPFRSASSLFLGNSPRFWKKPKSSNRNTRSVTWFLNFCCMPAIIELITSFAPSTRHQRSAFSDSEIFLKGKKTFVWHALLGSCTQKSSWRNRWKIINWDGYDGTHRNIRKRVVFPEWCGRRRRLIGVGTWRKSWMAWLLSTKKPDLAKLAKSDIEGSSTLRVLPCRTAWTFWSPLCWPEFVATNSL